MPSNEGNNQIFDVSKPGKTSAAASSRPIIVTHKMVQDPMMNDTTTKEIEEKGPSDTNIPTAASTASLPSRNKVIAPISEQKEEQKPVQAAKSDEPAKESQVSLTSSESAVVDAVAEQATSRKKNIDQSDADVEKQIVINKLIDDKKYFVKIKAPHHKQNARAAFVGLIVVLAAVAGVAAAADAEMLNLGFKLPFDFIKTNTAQTVSTTLVVTPPAVPVVKIDPVPIDAEAATWKLVKSGLGGFSVRIPDGWKAINYQGGNNIRVDNDVTYKKGIPAVIESLSGVYGGDSIARFQIRQFKTNDNFKILSGDEQKSEFNVGTMIGNKYVKKYPVVPQVGLGIYPGSDAYVYEFKSTDKVTYVLYNVFNYNQYSKDVISNFTKSDVNQLEIVEKAVRSLVIN